MLVLLRSEWQYFYLAQMQLHGKSFLIDTNNDVVHLRCSSRMCFGQCGRKYDKSNSPATLVPHEKYCQSWHQKKRLKINVVPLPQGFELEIHPHRCEQKKI